MINRRKFLAATAGLSLAVASPKLRLRADAEDCQLSCVGKLSYEELLALDLFTELIGLPSSWRAAEEGLHPIAPERVVVVSQAEKGAYNRTGLVVRMMDALAAYYQLPKYSESWASVMSLQEDLGLSIFCCGVALPKEFWRSGSVSTTNFPVDWWLFLFPGGFAGWRDTDAMFQGPLRMILLRVHQEPPKLDRSLESKFLAHLIYRIHVRKAKWMWAPEMDPMAAARFVNKEIVLSLRNLPYAEEEQKGLDDGYASA